MPITIVVTVITIAIALIVGTVVISSLPSNFCPVIPGSSGSDAINESYFSVTATAQVSDQNIDNDVVFAAQSISSESALVGQNINTFSINLYKAGTVSGNLIIGAFDTDRILKHEFATLDVSTLTDSAETLTFNFSQYAVGTNDLIGVKYEGTLEPGNSIYIQYDDDIEPGSNFITFDSLDNPTDYAMNDLISDMSYQVSAQEGISQKNNCLDTFITIQNTVYTVISVAAIFLFLLIIRAFMQR